MMTSLRCSASTMSPLDIIFVIIISSIHMIHSFIHSFIASGRMKWIPIAPIDYDFCYNALDVKSGYIPNLTQLPITTHHHDP